MIEAYDYPDPWLDVDLIECGCGKCQRGGMCRSMKRLRSDHEKVAPVKCDYCTSFIPVIRTHCLYCHSDEHEYTAHCPNCLLLECETPDACGYATEHAMDNIGGPDE